MLSHANFQPADSIAARLLKSSRTWEGACVGAGVPVTRRLRLLITMTAVSSSTTRSVSPSLKEKCFVRENSLGSAVSSNSLFKYTATLPQQPLPKSMVPVPLPDRGSETTPSAPPLK